MPDHRLPVLLLLASLALLVGLWQVDSLREAALLTEGAGGGDDFWDAYADLGEGAVPVVLRIERLESLPPAPAAPVARSPIPHVPIA